MKIARTKTIIHDGGNAEPWNGLVGSVRDRSGARFTGQALLQTPEKSTLNHMTGAWVVFIFVLAVSAAILALLHWTRAGDLVHRHIPDTPRRRILLSSVAFLITFAGVRGLTWSIHNGIGPFHDIHMGGRHIHHLVWGIL